MHWCTSKMGDRPKIGAPLKQQRSKILTEIVQATTFDHLNKSKENTTTTTTTVSWLQIEKKIKGKIFIVICSIFSLIVI